MCIALIQVHDAAKKLEQKRMEMLASTAETVVVARNKSNAEENSKQKVDSVNLSRMTERELRSEVEDSEAVNTGRILNTEFEVMPPNVLLYEEKPISSPQEEYFVFVD